MDWFLYDNGIRLERVKELTWYIICEESDQGIHLGFIAHGTRKFSRKLLKL